MRILILNGPNLNLLGQREPEIYGSQTLIDLENMCRKHGQSLGIEVECYQSSHEGHLIDALHRARNRSNGVVFNPGGYSHTSVALRDAIAAIRIPVIEVHISNIHAREEFRSRSITGGACAGQVCGMGLLGYEVAISALARILQAQTVQTAVEAPPAKPERAVAPARESREVREASREQPREEREKGEKAEKAETREEREVREEREEREGKRRRRGRRGGRGRRREQEGEGAKEGEREGTEVAAETDGLDIAERYANLKGVVVRRGLDILAEEEEEGEIEPLPKGEGLVTFQDSKDVIKSYAARKEEPRETLEVIPEKTPAKGVAPQLERVDPFAGKEDERAEEEVVPEVAPAASPVAEQESAAAATEEAPSEPEQAEGESEQEGQEQPSKRPRRRKPSATSRRRGGSKRAAGENDQNTPPASEDQEPDGNK